MISGVLGMGRRMAESRMTETVEAGTVVMGTDPETLQPVRTLTDKIFDDPVPARVKYRSTPVEGDAGEQPVSTIRPEVHVAVGSLIVPVGAVFEVQTSSVDPSLVGRVFKVTGPPQGGQTTAHRYPVSEES